ncbi:MAG: dethiobiotin synthase [Actinomycetota bacterium]|nr:dethiobiotin synthase [Actinomycetota bacterium]
MDGVFVTGTGTEVGKTVAAGVIARCAADAGQRVSVFKPAVSGLDDAATDGLVPDHEHLRMAARSEQSDDEIAPYRFGPAVSPHHAAALEGSEIDAERLRAGAAAALNEGDFCVCEGVGGFLVPLRLDYLVRDFAVELGLPVVIVASPGLGTINHTLLTVEAVRGADLEVTAVVLTPWHAEPTEMEESNLEAIEELGATAVHTLCQMDPGDPATWPALAL